MKKAISVLLLLFIITSLIPEIEIASASDDEEGWETVFENAKIYYHAFGTYGMRYGYFQFTDKPKGYYKRTHGDPEYYELGPGVHYVDDLDDLGINAYEGDLGSFDPRLYEYRITNDGVDLIHRMVSLGDNERYTNPFNFTYPYWNPGWGDRVYERLRDQAIIPARSVLTSNQLINGYYVNNIDRIRSFGVTNNDTGIYYESFAKLERRYVAKPPAVSSVSVVANPDNATGIATANVPVAGVPEIYEHGHIWSSDPSVELTVNLPTKTNHGSKYTTGQFTSLIRHLEVGKVYADVSVNPSRVKFTGQDINVDVTVKGYRFGNVGNLRYMLYARKEQDSQPQGCDTWGFSSEPYCEHTFTFTIPASVMNGKDIYTQKFIIEAKVRDTSYQIHDIVAPVEVETIVYRDGVTPPPEEFIVPIGSRSPDGPDTFYVRPYVVHPLGVFYGETQILRFNTPPVISITNPQEGQILSDRGSITIEGNIMDADNDDVYITVDAGGVIQNHNPFPITNTQNWKPFSFTLDIQENTISQGPHSITITADDRRETVTATINIEVSTKLDNETWILVNTLVTEYPGKSFSDPEGDGLYQEQYRFEHDPNHYDNPIGLFNLHNQWINLVYNGANEQLPVERFAHTGKYILDYRARDNPFEPQIKPAFMEFYKWSPPAANYLTFYVHRKPVSSFSLELSSSGSNHFDVYVKNYSYDQDNVSKPYRGISQVQVRYREVGSTLWTIKPAMNVNAGEKYYVARLPSGKNYEIAVRARDIDGRNNLGVWSEWAEKTFITASPPAVGFTVQPSHHQYRGDTFIIVPNADVGPATYRIVRNADNAVVYDQYHNNNNSWNRVFGTLNQVTDYYTIIQEVTGSGGVSASHMEIISVSNRKPTISNLRLSGSNWTHTSKDNPLIISDTSPSISWTYLDADGDRQTRYDVKIYDGEDIAQTFSQNTNLASGGSISTSSLSVEKYKTHKAEIRVFDGYEWSQVYTRYFKIQDNLPPVAEFDFHPNPSNRITPTQFTSLAQDPDNHISELSHVWAYRKKGSFDWNVFSNNQNSEYQFTELGTYEVRLTVTDPGGLSDSVIKDVPVVNLEPVADFDIIPEIAYEGDVLQAIDKSSDPEGDTIVIHHWQVFLPSGELLCTTQGDFSENEASIAVPTIEMPGVYNFRKRVMDEHGTWSTWTPWKSHEVNALQIEGWVHHTELWEQNRIKYNLSKTASNDWPRSYDMFFPGEKFILEAETTEIHPDRSDLFLDYGDVKAEIVGTSYGALLVPEYSSTGNHYKWDGELWDSRMLYWRSKSITFRFTASWPNGTVKNYDVPVIIDDDPYWRQRHSR